MKIIFCNEHSIFFKSFQWLSVSFKLFFNPFSGLILFFWIFNCVLFCLHKSTDQVRTLQDEINQVMTVAVWLRQTWLDRRLSWNPDEYGRLDVLHVPYEILWVPDLVLYK